ncbi:MAG: hypothetical protein P4L36_16190 [Holophaga sp.]|nr:hypothetical protein [Holophaga sp.]
MIPGDGQEDPLDGTPPPAADKDAWKLVYFGQISRDLVPYHPDPPEAPEDELTQAALSDPDGATRGESGAGSAPTFWRLLVVLAVAVVSLALVFWRTH